MTEGKDIELRVVAAGAYAREGEDRGSHVAMDEAAYQRIWAAKVGDEAAPVVDFEKQAVVFLFAGTRRTGGYSIKVHGARIEGEALVVDAEVVGPKRGAIVTQALTAPYAVLAVSARDFRDTEWNETSKATAR